MQLPPSYRAQFPQNALTPGFMKLLRFPERIEKYKGVRRVMSVAIQLSDQQLLARKVGLTERDVPFHLREKV
jgi:hypothetical protein